MSPMDRTVVCTRLLTSNLPDVKSLNSKFDMYGTEGSRGDILPVTANDASNATGGETIGK